MEFLSGLLSLSELSVCLLLVFAEDEIGRGEAWSILLLLLTLATTLACVIVILRQPQNRRKLSFMTPAVPILPCSAVFINIYLMLKLPPLTWARLGIWICIGNFKLF